MAQSITQIEQASELSMELAGAYTVGSLGAAAGIPGSYELQDRVVGLMAAVGVDLSGIEQETGIAAAAARTGIRAALSRFSNKAATSILRNPARWGAAIALGSAGVGTYNWLTPDQDLELGKAREQARMISDGLAQIPPEDRADVLKAVAGSTFGVAPSAYWPWIVGAGGIAAFGLWLYSGRAGR
jgi:hypothetical protein